MRLPCQTEPIERRASSSGSRQADGISPSLIKRYPGFTVIYVDGVQIIVQGGTIHTLL